MSIKPILTYLSVKKGIGFYFGVIYRDCFGEVFVASTSFSPSCFDPHVAKALAFRWTIKTMTTHLSFSVVVYELVCQRLICAWKNSKGEDRSYFSVVIANRATDTLASLAFNLKDKYWMEDAPHKLLSILADDVRPLVSFSN
ncbi:hypothetical protein GmHk_06G017658 [Glycine max]|nr:hypothetical protein GmHk_06G017658 [Glycine max]